MTAVLRWLTEFYSVICSFSDPSTEMKFNAQTVLQLCIKPSSYKVGSQTVGAQTTIDSRFPNETIEWSTKQRGSVILYGLLFKLVKLDEKQCSNGYACIIN